MVTNIHIRLRGISRITLKESGLNSNLTICKGFFNGFKVTLYLIVVSLHIGETSCESGEDLDPNLPLQIFKRRQSAIATEYLFCGLATTG